MENRLEISTIPYGQCMSDTDFDLDRIIYDLDGQIDLLSSQADTLDYLISVASGILCGMLDVLWVDEFSLERGREIASDKVEAFVKKTAKLTGCESDDLDASVKHLEKLFPIPSDGNTPDFGGGLQHHLRDFAHHPTIVGLMFSLLTQFTYKSYGTDTAGMFLVVDVPEKSRPFIGEDTPTKILYGTLTWFFHLASDMAGSSSTAGKTGGTGIPGPFLALAKELSVLPFFREMQIGEHGLSLFLSKLFNGTLLAEHDENGKIIKDTVLKFDLRGELGVATELSRQALPVIANECIVRGFYFIRRFAMELKGKHIHSLSEIRNIDWNNIKPAGNPTIARMLTVATGVFTTVDIGEAVISQKYWISINYVGIGRFAVAIGEDVAWGLKARKVKEIKAMYENIRQNTFRQEDQRVYERIRSGMSSEKLGLTLEQTEILYNLEYLVTLNDIQTTKVPIGGESVRGLKRQWLDEWQQSMTNGFASFVQIPDAALHWYSEQELLAKIEANYPSGTWFRLALLEAMLFEPYYPLTIETDKKGNATPSKKYSSLHNPICGFSKGNADHYLDKLFPETYYAKGYIKRLRKCHGKVIRELNEVLKTALTSLAITAAVTIAAIATAGAFAPSIAVALVGSNFAGLSGAALTSACLAYLGGGAIAVGGMGMAGGTIAIVGGGAILGLGVGAGVGGAVGAAGVLGKKNTILQSAKLMVSVREIFLNDEHDLAYSNTVYEQYVQNIMEIEKGLVELRLQHDIAKGKDKKLLKAKIKEAEDSVEAMKIARKSMLKFHSSFETGLELSQKNGAIAILQDIFDYDLLNGLPRHELLTAMDMPVCPYCNRQYITNYTDVNNQKTTADLDHYFCKSIYPYLSLSLYNFVPSCQICNSRFKIAKDFYSTPHLYPYQCHSHGKIKFKLGDDKLLLDEGAWNLPDIPFLDIVCTGEEAQNTAATFHLKEVYQGHKDYVHEIVWRTKIYNDDLIDIIQTEFDKLFGGTQDIKQLIFGQYMCEDEVHKRPLAKLTQDILDDLGVLE